MKSPRFLTPLIWICIGLAGGAGWLEWAATRTPLSHIDRAANAYYDRTLKQSLTTYAAARGLNAVISVVQASDVAVSPAGVGVRVAAGEILDPLNDLVERFSWVVLAAATSLGVQKMLLAIFAWVGLRLILPLAALAGLVATLWPGKERWTAFSSTAIRLVVLALALRYFLPLTALATDRVDMLFLDSRTQEASQALTLAAQEAEAPETPTPPTEDLSLVDKVKRFFKNIGEAAQLEQRIGQLKTGVTGLVDNLVDLIAIFVLKTLVMPLFILWLLGRLLTRLVHADPTAVFWRHMKNPAP